jgi:hypothetical protein
VRGEFVLDANRASSSSLQSRSPDRSDSRTGSPQLLGPGPVSPDHNVDYQPPLLPSSNGLVTAAGRGRLRPLLYCVGSGSNSAVNRWRRDDEVLSWTGIKWDGFTRPRRS